MQITLFIILLLILVLNTVFFVVYLKKTNSKNRQKEQEESESNKILREQINELSRTVDNKLGESNKNMTDAMSNQFSESQKLIFNINKEVSEHLKSVNKEIAETKEASKQVFTVAESLQSLEKVLKNQKQRGSLGEAGLELILGNILPPDGYKLQYHFTGRDIAVDAAIFAPEGIIPVDAKFSLDNYNRMIEEKDEDRRKQIEKEFVADIKKRIDETAKYINEKEGTLPFAFMFIPAEGIYYDLLVNKVGLKTSSERSLIEYAYQDKKVVIVSPTTFSAYLQSVLYGFKAFQIEERAQDIKKHVGALQKHLQEYEAYHTKLGNTLGTAVNHYNRTNQEFAKIDKDIVRIGEDKMKIDSPSLDQPQKD